VGLGIAVLPEWLIGDDLVSGRLVRVLPKWQARELPAHIVHAAQRRLPLRVRTFIDFAVNYMNTVLKPDKRQLEAAVTRGTALRQQQPAGSKGSR
jgi:DNA-binding transcriptional LysR family regulator